MPTYQQKVKTLREKLGLTQEDLAHLIGVSRVSVARWEAGIRKPSTMAINFMEHLLSCGKRKEADRGKKS